MGEHISARLLAQRVGLASFASLAVQTWDLVACITDEVEYLWIGQFSFIKGLYICTRYVMLLAQAVNQYLTFLYDETSLDSWLCPGIFVYKTVVSQVGLILLEMVLLVRVYALYNQSYAARCFLLGVFMITTTLETTGSGLVIKSFGNAGGCAARKASPTGVKFFGIGAGLCQVVVVSATLFKLITRRRVGWSRTPLTTLMLRQGLATFFIVLVLLVIIVGYGIIRDIDITTGDAALSWYITLLSIGASRLVLRMRKLVVEHRGGYDDEDRENDGGLDSEPVCLTVISE